MLQTPTAQHGRTRSQLVSSQNPPPASAYGSTQKRTTSTRSDEFEVLSGGEVLIVQEHDLRFFTQKIKILLNQVAGEAQPAAMHACAGVSIEDKGRLFLMFHE